MFVYINYDILEIYFSFRFDIKKMVLKIKKKDQNFG